MSDEKRSTTFQAMVGGRRLVTEYAPPPIPIRIMDWQAVTDDYEPGDPIGHGETEKAAIDDLFEQMEALSEVRGEG